MSKYKVGKDRKGKEIKERKNVSCHFPEFAWVMGLNGHDQQLHMC